MSTLARVLNARLWGGNTQDSASNLITAAELPEPIAQRIGEIVRRTRLRAVERAEVARELCAHFADGLAAGATPDVLLRDFGDPRAAARLIRRAVVRKRGPVWRAFRGVGNVIAALLLLVIGAYVVLFVRYQFAEPRLSRNYAKEINARILASPERDRAYPRYLDVMSAWSPMPDRQAYKRFPPTSPDSPDWPAAEAYVRSNAENLAALRVAAALPAFGLTLSHSIHPVFLGFNERIAGVGPQPPWPAAPSIEDNPPLYGVLLPHLGPTRELARCLSFEARLAAREGKGTRVAENIRAMVGMAEHMRETRLLISDLVAIAIVSLAADVLGDVLADTPAVLSDADLTTIAHALASFPRDNSAIVRFDGERIGFADTLQRVFTDDGSGNGRLTAKGFATLSELSSGQRVRSYSVAVDRAVLGPLGAVAIAPRAEQARAFEHLIGLAEAKASTPMWTWTDEAETQFENFYQGSRVKRIRYLPVWILTPALDKAAESGVFVVQLRDAMLTAVAIELHTRRAGAPPASLDQIPTTLLPTIPRDAFDGGPIKYAVRNGRPVLYSVGADRTDNGATPPPEDESVSRARRWMSPARLSDWLNNFAERSIRQHVPDIRGDWVIWPRPRVAPAE